ncbi:MAG: putative bifunctional diguanylate cyclase/phosphodiesterase [Ilumatobacter sp.]
MVNLGDAVVDVPTSLRAQHPDLFDHIAQLTSDAIFVAQDGEDVFVNQAGLDLLGVASLDDVVPGTDANAAHGAGRLVRADGTVREVETSTATVQYQGRPAQLMILRDITHQVSDRAARNEAESRFNAAVSGARLAVGLLDDDRRFVMANEALEALCGTNSAVGANLSELIDPDCLANVERLFHATGHDGGSSTRSSSITFPTAQNRWFDLSLRQLTNDREATYVAQIQEVTRQRQHEALLTQQSCTDSLTGLANREALLNKLVATLGSSGSSVAVALCDLDNFKTVNDSLGHHVGDQLLQIVTERLRPMMRAGDLLARFGGDEFAVLMNDAAEPAIAKALARRLAKALAEPIELEGRWMHMSASIGLALGRHGDSADDLLSDADAAMYDAKRNGRARYELADSGHRARARNRLEIDRALRSALANDELEPHYQPVIDIMSGRVVAVEALARWCRDGEMVSPGVFIPIAEASGLIGELDRYMLRQAARQVRRWVDEGTVDGNFKVSVNVAAQELRDEELVLTLRSILDETKINPGQLVIEVTERDAVETSGAMVGITAIRHMGVGLALDDFGIGHSSLARLSSLPFDVLKIDRSFVSQATEDDRNARLLVGIARMGESLGHLVLAEGVETAEQYRMLADAGVNFAQGYLLTRPASSDDIGDILRSGQRFRVDSFD